jgi:phenylalanyl-tRNA synthetase beta chain
VRVPLSWLREHVDVTTDVDELSALLTNLGLEVEAVLRPSGGVRGVVVAEVAAVSKIAGSDKLHLVEAFDGATTHTIVCGASNYAPGDRVAAALPGSTLPGPDPDTPLEVGRKTLFGHISNGMLASPRELGVGDDHRGIWLLDEDMPLGADVAELLDLDDPVLDVKVNPDRGYALSILGVARDVAAATGAALRLPEPTPATGDPGVPVTIADPSRCLRFDARRITGVRLGPSPARVQRRLAAAGMRPISNVVDATNYAMLETGHPVHAYDVALLAGPRIDVRDAAPGETVVTLDGTRRPLDPDDLVIADADGPVGLAGVMGGDRTEVSDATTDLLVEVASFDPVAVLRTARRHKLFTEASTRFEKTVPAHTVPLGATRAAALITELAGGRMAGGSDTYPVPVERPVIRLSPARARSWLGLGFAAERQQALLEAIGCAVEAAGDVLAVTPPAYRPDLRLPADLYEELARLEGYESVPERVPSTGRSGGRSPEHEAVRAIRRALAGGGWTEVLAFPFVAADDVERLGVAADDPRRRPVPLVNPLSGEEAVLRTTLLPGLLKILRRNANRQVADVAVFEVGHVFLPPTADEPGAAGGPGDVLLPAEPQLLGVAACGAFEPVRHDRPARGVDLYDLLGALDLARRAVGLPPFVATATDEAPFHPGRAARLSLEGVDVGVVGELHPRVVAAWELPDRSLAGEVRLDRIVAGGIRVAAGTAPSTLPGLRFDVAVVVDDTVPAAEVEAAVRAGAGDRLTSCRLFDVFAGSQLGQGKRSLAYALVLDDTGRQLTDADEAAAIDAVEAAVAERVGGRLRR